ncbi:Myblike DNAbinding domain-containing protein [Entomortierella chlamydospora]|uniref:Myblike DNAbinding domain-containing protein n=1 Tax=Entomortierella chlamydospora TaxID=101097 RepID=A0A9P6MVE5_9FUNG|nr:Myblike DNAbinding domain-containing protein [Entomortierella chlamydospora]KAG0015094.1 Myblike DNAbinding domain-containing protein [Entomortierella chlamydospora]
MAWIAQAIGTGARGTKSQLSACSSVNLSLHAAIPSKQKILMRSSHYVHRRHWIHSSPKSRSEQATTIANATQNKTGASTTATSLTNNAAAEPAKKQRKAFNAPRPLVEWTPEQDAKIVELRLEGNSWQEIGEALGHPAVVVRQRYSKALNPLQEAWDPAKLDRLNAAVIEGKSWRQISSEFMMPQTTVREKWKSINPELVYKSKQVKLRKRRITKSLTSGRSRLASFRDTGFVAARARRWSDVIDAVLLDLRDRGLSWRQIGWTLVMTPSTCLSRFNYLTKVKLKSGWIPPKLDHSNSPSYLLPNRARATLGELASLGDNNNTSEDVPSATLVERQDEQDNSTDPPKDILGLISEDFSYSTFEAYTNRAWTKEEDEYILKNRAENKPFSSIASDLGLETRDCFFRFYTALDPELGDKKSKEWTPKLVEKLLFYVSQGVPWSTIATDLGIHRIICKEKYREITGMPCSEKGPNGETNQGIRDDSPVAAQSSGDHAEEDSDQDQARKEGAKFDDYDYDYDYDSDEDDHDEDDDQGDDDIIDDLRDDYEPHDAASDDEDNDDSNDDDMLDSGSSYLSEGFADDPIRTGRRSKKHSSIARRSTIPSDTWDQESLLRELKKTWTPEEETTLIQHVIRNGTRGWHEVSSALDGRHSADECRAYWKYLDMPLCGYRPPVPKWDPHREAQFWRLWLEHGSNYEDISRKLNKSDATDDADSPVSTSRNRARWFSAKDCEELFTHRTKTLRSESGEEVDNEKFQKSCVELALTKSKAPPFQWDKQSSVKLQKLVLQRLRTRGVHVNWINWKWVARHVGEGATANRCNIHWRVLRAAETRKSDWTDEELLLLERGVREVGAIFNHEKEDPSLLLPPEEGSDSYVGPTLEGFRAVQKFYLPHIPLETLQRKYFLLSDKASRVTVREYMAIMDAVDEFGENQWDKVVESLKSHPSSDSSASSASSRAGESSGLSGWTKAPCRRVWESSYKYQLLYTKWTLDEDQDLKVVVDRIGQRDWMSVSRFFPGKSAWQCRLRWCQLTDPVQPVQSS